MLIFGGVVLQYDLLEFHVFLTKKIWGWVVLRGKLFLQSSFWVVKGDFTKWWRKWGASIQVVGGIEHYSSRSLKGLFFFDFLYEKWLKTQRFPISKKSPSWTEESAQFMGPSDLHGKTYRWVPASFPIPRKSTLGTLQNRRNYHHIWSNYNDLTRPHPKKR